jgi:CHASE3 domain sensor protein
LSQLVSEKLAELDTNVSLRRSGQTATAFALVETGHGKRTMDSIRVVLAEVLAHEKTLLARRQADEDGWARTATMALIGGTLAAAILALFLNGLLTRYATAQAEAKRKLDVQNEQLCPAI